MITNHFPRVADEDLDAFVARAQEIRDRHHKQESWSGALDVLGYHHGRRTWWTRVYVCNQSGDPASLFCFVDRRNGNVLYGKGWKGPVKKPSGVRGNIYSETEEGLGINWHGAKYLR